MAVNLQLPWITPLDRLKLQARKHLIAYREIADQYDCGAQMTQWISAEAADHAREFDSLMDQIRAIDPTAPSTRLVAV